MKQVDINNATQEEYRDALQAQWDADSEVLLVAGIVPPWDVSGGVLDDDEARVMTLAADHGGLEWSNTNPHICAPTIARLNMAKGGNVAFILKKLQKKGWLKFSGGKLKLTSTGMRRLDIHDENYDGEEFVEGVYVAPKQYEVNIGLFV